MPHPIWEYQTLPEDDRGRLADLGRVGWELVGVGGAPGDTRLYLKRKLPDLRERVTLDQRRRYYESLALDPDASPVRRHR